MGLIKAVLGSIGGTFADQWKEFIYCDSIPNDVLAVRGRKKTTGRSSNTKGNDNIITSGSGIAVADGQCMIIVEQGRIAEICAEPGEFTFDASTEPSLFCGSLGKGLLNTFRTVGKRFTYGGDTGKDQRVYYFNIKELVDNKFGTPNPVPFRVVDANIGLDVDISVRCNGVYSYKIMDPLLFYTNVCGNVQQEYTRENIDRQLKTEFLNALQPAFARISGLGIRYSALPGHTGELCEAMNNELNAKWQKLRGLEIVSIGINSINAPKEDEDMIKELQRTAVFRNPNMAGAAMVGAQADAMKAAAANSGGVMAGFMGVNMAQQAGGLNAQNLFAMGQQQSAQNQTASDKSVNNKNEWKCVCGAVNNGKFCAECGAARPSENGWTCACGNVNKGKFCAECGKPKPADALLYKCDKCGWEPEDPENPPKFCPECGDKFDENDACQ